VIPDSFASAVWNEVREVLGPAEVTLRQSVYAGLDDLVLQIEAEIGVKANARVSEGKPFAEITARSEDIDADLIVVGARGENLFLTPLLGRTAHRILRLSRRPVLLVKQTPPVDETAKSGYQHMIVATDFAADSAYAAQSARQLFPRTTATLFHAYEVPFEAKLTQTVPRQTLERSRGIAAQRAYNELAAFAHANLSDAHRVIRHGSPVASIREFAKEIGADLIVTGSEEVPRLQTALLGSVSLDLVTESTCDVLLARTTPPSASPRSGPDLRP
jgi:nucleotide-binding universal stress UspA family protein